MSPSLLSTLSEEEISLLNIWEMRERLGESNVYPFDSDLRKNGIDPNMGGRQSINEHLGLGVGEALVNGNGVLDVSLPSYSRGVNLEESLSKTKETNGAFKRSGESNSFSNVKEFIENGNILDMGS